MRTYGKLRPLCLKITTLFLFSCIVAFTSCEQEKIDPLEKAQTNVEEANYISYTSTAYFPIPNSRQVRKEVVKSEYLKDSLDPVGYQYSMQSTNVDRLYQNNELKLVSHKLKSIRVSQPQDFYDDNQFKDVVKNNFVRKNWSPLGLLENQWEYVRDSVYENVHLTNYYRISGRGLNGDVQIITEHHIFVDDDGFIRRFERRNLNDGVVMQSVIFDFSDYQLKKENGSIQYKVPANYSVVYGKSEKPSNTSK